MFINELLQDGIIEEVQEGYFSGYKFDGKEFNSLDDVEGYILDQMYMDYMRNNKEVIEEDSNENFEITLSKLGEEYILEVKQLKVHLINSYTSRKKAIYCYNAMLEVLKDDVR